MTAYLHRPAPGERRTLEVTALNAAAVIPHNFRVLRMFTQGLAAQWYGVSERTWRRWESDGAPAHVLKRIASWARKTELGRLNLPLLVEPRQPNAQEPV
jgi:hypothetical protein